MVILQELVDCSLCCYIDIEVFVGCILVFMLVLVGVVVYLIVYIEGVIMYQVFGQVYCYGGIVGLLFRLQLEWFIIYYVGDWGEVVMRFEFQCGINGIVVCEVE